jgi:hypothetical protein
MVPPGARPATRRASRPARRLAVLLAAAVVLGACSGGDGDDAADDSTTTAAAVEGFEVALEIGRVTVAGVRDGAELASSTQRAVLTAAERYVQSAMVSPAVRGEIGPRFPRLFAPATRELVTAGGRDHVVLTDDGIPRATATPELTTTPVELDALVATDGRPALVVATFRARTNTETEDGPVEVGRSLELTFEPIDGDWLVTAYKVFTKREGTGPTTTTASATSEPEAS